MATTPTNFMRGPAADDETFVDCILVRPQARGHGPGRAGGWCASDRQAWLFLDDSRFGSQHVGVEQESQPDEHWDQSEEVNRTVRQDRNQKHADSDARRR